MLAWLRRRVNPVPPRAALTVTAGETDCPSCGAEDATIPVRYGKPTADGLAAAQRGEFKAGGCAQPGRASRYCTQCESLIVVESD